MQEDHCSAIRTGFVFGLSRSRFQSPMTVRMNISHSPLKSNAAQGTTRLSRRCRWVKAQKPPQQHLAGETSLLEGPRISRFVTRNFAIILTEAVMIFAAADPQERRKSGDNVIREIIHVDHSKYSSCNKERFTRREGDKLTTSKRETTHLWQSSQPSLRVAKPLTMQKRHQECVTF